jgi:serine-type D-Ala-D-Ala carboxypeptidase (penicillin-binding protein 5/6)
MPTRVAAAALVGCLLATAAVTTSGTTGANALAAAGGPVGGPLLAARGVVVRPLAGAPTLPPASELPASSWMVSNLTTGQVLAAKDPHGKFLPASTLKTLTAVTLLPRLDPSSTFKARYNDATVDGSRVGLVPGMSYSIEKLFACMLVVSANDAADALAQANGGVDVTVREMNAKAHQLQAYDTLAKTPSGLDGPGETTSAYDLTLITQAGLAMPAFRHYISIVHSTVPAPHHKHFAIYTHNELLTSYRGDIGGKNGYTVAAMGTDINVATRHGQTIVVTLMHAYPDFWPMAAALLDWGFKANGKVEPVGTLVGPLTPRSAAPAALSSTPQPVSSAAAAAVRHNRGWPWFPTEIVAICLVGLVLLLLIVRRRRQLDRQYRARLKLPPV